MKFWCAAVVSAAVTVAGCGKNRIVGEADGQRITADDFRQRYRKYIESSGDRDNILVREKILNNMINERLIFEDAHRQRFDDDSVYAERMQEITGQAILDAYARRLTTDTMRVTDAEMMDEFRATNTRVSARYVYAGTPEDARQLKLRLEGGESFEKIAGEVFHDRTLATSGGSLGFFGYGEMERALEQAAFGLPVGTLSDPVKLKIGYAIIRVDKRVVKPLSSEYDYAKAKPSLEETIRHRKVASLLARETDRIGEEIAPRFQDPGLNAAARFWSGGGLWNRDVTEFPSAPDSIRSLPLVVFKGGSWTVGQFLAGALDLRRKDRLKIRSSDAIKDAVTGLLTRGVLLDRARRAGLESNEQVQEQVRYVRDDFLLRRWRTSILDSLGNNAHWDEDSLRARYASDKNQYMVPPTVNVAEIVVAQERDAAGLARRVRNGENFAALARHYSVRRWSAEKGGELGFAPKEAFGNLAEKFFKASPGTIIGPERIENFTAIFTVLAKRGGRPKTYEESRPDIIAALLPKREETALANALTSLRTRGNVRVDMEALSLVVVSAK